MSIYNVQVLRIELAHLDSMNRSTMYRVNVIRLRRRHLVAPDEWYTNRNKLVNTFDCSFHRVDCTKQTEKQNDEINIINHGDKIKQNFFLYFQSDEMPNEMSEYSLD